MLIETIIEPRKDGAVKVDAGGGVVYSFEPAEDGMLVCEVADQGHALWLLGLGNFFPADDDEDLSSSNDESGPAPLEGNSLAEMLANMDKSGLIEYAKQNAVDGVDARMSVATLRQKITEALSAA